ncbi:MAG: cyclic pyranopterin monophosphate synthase MoaC [Planctomycetota bacterium]
MTAGDSPLQPTHLDAQGRARMVDVSEKASTARRAIARAIIELTSEVRRAVLEGALPKGEALGVARVAGIQAAKETARLLPLCHPLPLTGVEVRFEPSGDREIEVRAEVRTVGPTGVEMEALCAANVAALTIYDMTKALHRGARIHSVELLLKSGGRSGEWRRPEAS